MEVLAQDVNAIDKNFRDIVNVSLPEEKPSEKELTLVTGLWNINREGRPFEHYIENFRKFLDIPQNLFIFIPAEYEY